jgi:hypothetical protein
VLNLQQLQLILLRSHLVIQLIQQVSHRLVLRTNHLVSQVLIQRILPLNQLDNQRCNPLGNRLLDQRHNHPVNLHRSHQGSHQGSLHLSL